MANPVLRCLRNRTWKTTADIFHSTMHRRSSRLLCRQTSHGAASPALPIIKVNKMKTGMTVTLPGYGYDDLDRSGHVGLHKVARCGEATRMILYSPQFSATPQHDAEEFRNLMAHIFQDKLIFMLTASYKFFPSFYDNRHIYNRTNTEDRIVNIGKSSYQHMNVTVSEATKQVLHESVITLVIVDRETRKPAGFSASFEKHFQDKIERIPVEKVDTLRKPDCTNENSYQVKHSDLDYYQHMNQSQYVRVCVDAMVKVALLGVLRGLKGDIGRHRVKSLKCFYQKETKVGETLVIHVWENEDNPYVLHAIAENLGQSAFQCSIEFVPFEQTAKL